VEAYDPLAAPNPREWLVLSELERLDLVEAFHAECGDFGESLRLHASVHVVVENQLALREPPEVTPALSRLMLQGLDRHDALHAIATVLAEHLFPVLKAASSPPPFNDAAYRDGLRNLSSESWRA
jgi:hypothetical protein